MSSSTPVARFFEACVAGNADVVRGLIASEPDLARATNPDAPHEGWTGLHAAAKAGYADIVRLLLEHGADLNAREAGDNTYALHWAAASGNIEIVRTLLNAGGDVHGIGDLHELDVIGWATFYRAADDELSQMNPSRQEMVSLLVDRGARHHIFSAICVGDLDLIRQVVAQNPGALDRRMSRFEHKLTPLHFAVSRKRYDILDLLIELGADVEAEDMSHQTALTVAILRGDRAAIDRLRAAGAALPARGAARDFRSEMAALGNGGVKKSVAMIRVPDVAQALDWYTSIGFKELGRFADDGVVNFGMVSFGQAELMLNMNGKAGPHDVSLWFYTDRIDKFYELLKARQLDAAQAALTGEPGGHAGIEFEQDIEDMFYGARQFCIRDLNGYELYFIQSVDA